MMYGPNVCFTLNGSMVYYILVFFQRKMDAQYVCIEPCVSLRLFPESCLCRMLMCVKMLVHHFLGLLSSFGSTLNQFLGRVKDTGKINVTPLKSQSQRCSTSSTMKIHPEFAIYHHVD